MRVADVLRVLDALDAGALPWWLDGGWGVDALLGRQSRPHRDLDVVVERRRRVDVVAALRPLGFQVDGSATPGLPARQVLADAEGRSLDLHLVVLDERGNGWQQLNGGAWGAYPAEGLAGQGWIAGHPVRCVTPQLQLLHHLGYPPLAHDLADLRRLADRFDLALPPGWR